MHSQFKLFSSRLLVLVLNFQLLVPTNVYSVEKKAIDNVLNVLGQGGALIQGQMQQMQMQQLSTQKKNELRNILSIQTADPRQIPEVIAQSGCPVIGARSNNLNMDMQCTNAFDPQLYFSGHYEAYQEIAEDNYNSVEAILSKQHNRDSADGVTCYQKAQHNFATALEARVETLKKQKEKLNQLVKNFQTKNQQRVEQMRKADALLNGPGGNDKLMKDAIKDFKFDQTFGDSQCKSYFDGNKMTQSGQKSGLRGIESMIEGSKDKIQPESFKAQMGQMQKEIRSLASKLSQDAASSKVLAYDPNVIGSSKLTAISPSSAALKNTLDRVQAKAQLDIKQLDTKTTKMIGSDTAQDAQKIMTGIKSNSIDDVEFKLSELERTTKLSCVQDVIEKSQFKTIDNFANQFDDPSASKGANEEADRPFLNYVKTTLQRKDISINKMKELITLRQNSGGNSRLVTKLNQTNHFEIKGRSTTIGASQLQRPADLVGVFVDKCNEVYEDQANDQGSTTKEVIDGLRKYNTEYQKVQKSFAVNIGSELIESLINCPSDNKTGKAANTCNAGVMDSNAANFCLKTANTCASNIMACDAKIKNMINDTRTKQVAIAKTYKAEMDSLKLGLAREINLMAATNEQQARILDAKYKFGTVYKSPTGMDLSLKDDEQIFDKIIQDASLKIEDPIAFQEKINENIDKIIKQTQEHNKVLAKGLDSEVQKYIANAEKEKAKWKDIATACHNKIDAEYAKYVADINKQNQEQQKAFSEKRQKECKQYYDFKSDPCPGGKVSDVAGDVSMIAAAIGDPVASQGIQQTINSCQLHSNQSNSTDGTDAGKLASQSTINDVCGDEDLLKKNPDLEFACRDAKKKPDINLEVCTVDDIQGNEEVYDKLIATYCINEDSGRLTSIQNEGCQKGSVEIDSKNKDDALAIYVESKLKSSEFEKLGCVSSKEMKANEQLIAKWEKSSRAVQSVVDDQNRAKQASEVGQLDFAYCDNINDSPVNEKGYGQQDGRDVASQIMQGFMVQGAQ